MSATSPENAFRSSDHLIKFGFSIKALVTKEADPNAVPRIVWGLRNLQKASLKWSTLSHQESLPAASTLEQAWQFNPGAQMGRSAVLEENLVCVAEKAKLLEDLKTNEGVGEMGSLFLLKVWAGRRTDVPSSPVPHSCTSSFIWFLSFIVTFIFYLFFFGLWDCDQFSAYKWPLQFSFAFG